jgi:lipopolysaccharide export system protein LptA
MFKIFKFFLFTILSFSISFAQSEDEPMTIIGDSLLGKVIDGESVREVIGNVTLTQGNVIVTCNRAIQYLAKNEAELIGNVVARQDSLTLNTEKGFYYGDLRKAKSTSRINLDDTKVILSADSGVYYFDESRAFFQSNVKLKDSLSTLYTDELTYFKKEDKTIAIKNVRVVDDNSELKADTLIHFRKNKNSIADGNVRLMSFKDNTTIFGEHLEDYANKKYTLINENPLLMQIDTISTVTSDSLVDYSIDTLLISCKVMEGYRDTTNSFKAIDSVKIFRSGFASLNDFTLFLRSEDRIITEKISESSPKPVLWYENSQLTGDSINIFLEGNQIKMLEVFENAFMLSQNKKYPERFDQSSSKNIELHFEDSKLLRAEFDEKVQNIYYLFEEEEPNGLSKSTAMSAAIIFENNEVSQVRLYGSPTSEFYPEEKVIGLERTFTLPKFVFNENRPLKNDLLKGIEK